MDQTQLTQITTIAGAVIAAALSLITVYQGVRAEEGLHGVVEGIRGLNRRIDRLMTEQFQGLLGLVRELTGSMSGQVTRIEEKLDDLLRR